MLLIRPERKDEYTRITQINDAVFGQHPKEFNAV